MKKVIIFTQEDKIFTNKILNNVLKNYSDLDFYIKLSSSSFLRKLKVLFCLLMFSKLTEISKLLKFEKLSKKFKIIYNIEDVNFDFGIIINYPKKIVTQKYNIFNFHLGSLKSQRGSFIFFYKFMYNWEKMFLTFHKITEKLDVGEIINEKEFNCKNMSSIEVASQYKENFEFIKNSIDMVKNTNYSTFKVDHLETFKQPSLYEIVDLWFKKVLFKKL